MPLKRLFLLLIIVVVLVLLGYAINRNFQLGLQTVEKTTQIVKKMQADEMLTEDELLTITPLFKTRISSYGREILDEFVAWMERGGMLKLDSETIAQYQTVLEDESIKEVE